MKDTKILEDFSEGIVDAYEVGSCFMITDLEKLIFKKASTKFDSPNIKVGDNNKDYRTV